MVGNATSIAAGSTLRALMIGTSAGATQAGLVVQDRALSRGENAGIGDAAAITAGSTSAIRVVPPITRTVAAMVATHRCALQSETAAIVDPATITALTAAKSSVAGNVGTHDTVGNKQGSCVVDAATRSACGAFTVLTLCTGSTPIVTLRMG